MRTDRLFAATVLLVALCSLARGDSFMDQLRDEDGWLDASDWVLNNAVGFMPVPLIITEPAIGTGFGVAALFFHPPDDYSAEEYEAQDESEQKFVMPDVSAVAGAYTDNGTWFLGGGHFAHWRNDTIRYEGLVGLASVNLRFYGLGGPGSIFDRGQNFTSDAVFLQQPISFRMGQSDWFLGVEYEYAQVETKFDLGTGIPEIDNLTFDVKLSSLQAFARYDSRDNKFTPNKGILAEVGIGRRDEAIGSDFNFTRFDGKIFAYTNIGSKIVVGGRLQTQNVDGDVPFFSVPFISLRGIPAMRFQGETVLVSEVSARWAMHPRISAVGFLGLGKAASSYGGLSDATSRVTQGLGLRYYVARKLGMHAGFDVAKGPEDTHFYLTFGSPWH